MCVGHFVKPTQFFRLVKENFVIRFHPTFFQLLNIDQTSGSLAHPHKVHNL